MAMPFSCTSHNSRFMFIQVNEGSPRGLVLYGGLVGCFLAMVFFRGPD